MVQAFATFSGQLEMGCPVPGVTGPALGPRWKLATIWFDKVLLEEPETGFWSEMLISSAIEKGELTSSTADEFKRILGSVTVEPRLYNSCIFRAQNSSQAIFLKAAREVVRNTLMDIHPMDEILIGGRMPHPGAVRAGAVTAMIRSLGAWWSENNTNPCSLLPGRGEQRIVDKVVSMVSTKDLAFDVFSRILDLRVPDLSNMSWKHILELRHHPHLESFRRKVSELANAGWECDEIAVAELLEEIELRELRELARICHPGSMATTVLRIVVSNIPLPLNPFSVGEGLKDLYDQSRLQSRFGWLYFLIDVSES